MTAPVYGKLAGLSDAGWLLCDTKKFLKFTLHYIESDRANSNLEYNDGLLRFDIEKFFCNKKWHFTSSVEYKQKKLKPEVPKTLTKA